MCENVLQPAFRPQICRWFFVNFYHLPAGSACATHVFCITFISSWHPASTRWSSNSFINESFIPFWRSLITKMILNIGYGYFCNVTFLGKIQKIIWKFETWCPPMCKISHYETRRVGVMENFQTPFSIYFVKWMILDIINSFQLINWITQKAEIVGIRLQFDR